jgi:hypothetical protein
MQRQSEDSYKPGDPNQWIENEFDQLDHDTGRVQTREDSFRNHDKVSKNEKRNSKDNNLENSGSKKSLTDHLRDNIIRRQTFTYVHQQNMKIDTKSLLYVCLLLYLVEYLIIFAFQLVSYLVIKEMWQDSSWVIGVVLAIVYVPVCIAIYYVQFRKEKIVLYILKFLEFGIHFVFLGWAVAYVDFSFMGLTYVVIANIIVIFIFVE